MLFKQMTNCMNKVREDQEVKNTETEKRNWNLFESQSVILDNSEEKNSGNHQKEIKISQSNNIKRKEEITCWKVMISSNLILE